MFQRGSKFYSKISSSGSIFIKKLVPGGTNFGGSIFAVTRPFRFNYTSHAIFSHYSLSLVLLKNNKLPCMAMCALTLYH